MTMMTMMNTAHQNSMMINLGLKLLMMGGMKQWRFLSIYLLMIAQKQLIFASKWTTASHHGVGDASLNTHLQSFDTPITMEEEWPSLETPT